MDFNVIRTEDVLRLCGVPVVNQHSDQVMVDCPICGGKKKLSVKLSTGLLNCKRASCGYKGNAIQLYKDVYNVSSWREAGEMILKELNLDTEEQEKLYRNRVKREQRETPKESSLAPIEVRDDTYRAFLDMLTLSDEHIKDLKSRGMDMTDIEAGMYKTVSNTDLAKLTWKVKEGHQITGVPGFYRDVRAQRDTFRRVSDGFLVPYLNEHNQIQAMQLRVDEDARLKEDGEKLPKYFWVSSAGRENGCGSGSPTHWACDFEWDKTEHTFNVSVPENKQIALTEGALKASILHSVTKMPTIAVAGVSCFKAAKEALDVAYKRGFRVLLLAFDMDAECNEDVAVALNKMKAMGREIGFKTIRFRWNRLYKGIDDYVIAEVNKKAGFQFEAFDGKCDVCMKSGKVVKLKSRTGNKEHCYCQSCMEKEYEPYKTMVEYVADIERDKKVSFPKGIPELQMEVIKKTLAAYDRSEDKFIEDVRKFAEWRKAKK